MKDLNLPLYCIAILFPVFYVCPVHGHYNVMNYTFLAIEIFLVVKCCRCHIVSDIFLYKILNRIIIFILMFLAFPPLCLSTTFAIIGDKVDSACIFGATSVCYLTIEISLVIRMIKPKNRS